MDELIAVLHDTIASGLELDFIAGVHRFDMVVEKLLENHEIPYFSMCSGTGLDSRCHDALASFWSAQYGTKFRWRELGVCEHNEKKQRWLRSQHAHIEVLVSELEEMQENVVKNIKDEKRAVYQAFPYCWDGGAGWPCTSLTSLNCATPQRTLVLCRRRAPRVVALSPWSTKLWRRTVPRFSAWRT